MNVQLIIVPYDSGLRGTRMGAGPKFLLQRGLEARLSAAGHSAEITFLKHTSPFATEVATAFDLMKQVAHQVRRARAHSLFPIILAGNCSVSVGVAAGLDCPGIAWFDAHGDFETPETTTSGFFDGMALGILAGLSWQRMASQIPGHSAIPGSNIALLAARDLAPEERRALESSGVVHVSADELHDGDRWAVVDEFTRQFERLHVHVDLDVLDPGVGHANSFAVHGGLNPSEVCRLISYLGVRVQVAALTIASYDPTVNTSGTVAEAALDIVSATVRAAAQRSIEIASLEDSTGRNPTHE